MLQVIVLKMCENYQIAESGVFYVVPDNFDARPKSEGTYEFFDERGEHCTLSYSKRGPFLSTTDGRTFYLKKVLDPVSPKVWQSMDAEKKKAYKAWRKKIKELHEERKRLRDERNRQRYFEIMEERKQEIIKLFISHGWDEPSDYILNLALHFYKKQELLVEFIKTSLDENDFRDRCKKIMDSRKPVPVRKCWWEEDEEEEESWWEWWLEDEYEDFD
ncbi:hypothetical protein EDM57_04910 [Brevibacillus gelatini]|uniref:Uncharacterized protein n=1 Tax=Brevibacillus gelatini TaxID=1655277 RepID=A0A3M8B9H9_9BACL|nr:hypothetical protein [Brevibacillus gelatini]RNB59485.1 hypothetical protein EDM57_04910 [Brevibacillus gelatini]